MKYRAKRDFLGVTKGMEFSVDKDGDIKLPITNSGDCIFYLDPTKYPADFELVEELKYTESDLGLVIEIFANYRSAPVNITLLKQAIAELKQSKEKK